MLVLTRKVGDVIAIGDNIKIVVMAIKGKQVRLGVQADRSTVVHREEIYQKIQQEIKAALNSDVNNTKVASEMLRTATEAQAKSGGLEGSTSAARTTSATCVVRKGHPEASEAFHDDGEPGAPEVRPPAKPRARKDKSSSGD